MIDIQEYIDSGVLELYVYGTLSEAESAEVSRLVALHPELKAEVEHIEIALQQLTSAAAPFTPSSFDSIQSKIQSTNGEDVIPLLPIDEESSQRPIKQISKRTIFISSLGWVATILLLVVLGYQFAGGKKLEDKITTLEREQILQQAKTDMAEEELVKANEMLDILRTKDIISVPLGAQEISPEAYASIYWNKETDKAYVDVRGLPTPPKGKVYQLWSLTLDPLTPTSMAVLDQYDANGTQLFEVNNPNASEAFGITLEPEGGSASPTLEQLYVLGVVEP
ncbi:anti-sigma factor [uncultured Dokdonia sp.]|uniref:anti-sigma factor n=1 Tax=uncultured Dokdonia sp. TaxID=575653 RepID=UPI002639804B|nr:anti-sigma factor [uncultured Dokdonia sp.]